jgi:hypothetical protein
MLMRIKKMPKDIMLFVFYTYIGVLHYVYLDAVFTPELVYPNGYRFYG